MGFIIRSVRIMSPCDVVKDVFKYALIVYLQTHKTHVVHVVHVNHSAQLEKAVRYKYNKKISKQPKIPVSRKSTISSSTR